MNSKALDSTPRPRNLVVVRAGHDSLHQEWMVGDRTWDLAVSSFGSQSADAFPGASYFDFYKGGKWDGLYRFFEVHPDLLSNYDYIWLPDDDIRTTGDQVNMLFALMQAYQLELAQPSLLAKSYFYHPITLQCPLTRVRYTNFAEVMVPVLRVDVLRQVLPYFQGSQSGWGIDHLWAKFTSDPGHKCAIFDEVAVHHTRPVGSVLAKAMQSRGKSGLSEMDVLAELFDVHAARPLCFAAITRWNTLVKGTPLCGLVQFLGQAPWFSRGRHARSGARVFLGSLYSHLTLKPNFSRIASTAPLSVEADPAKRPVPVAAE